MFTKTGLRIGGEGRQILQYPADQKYWIIYSYSTYIISIKVQLDKIDLKQNLPLFIYGPLFKVLFIYARRGKKIILVRNAREFLHMDSFQIVVLNQKIIFVLRNRTKRRIMVSYVLCGNNETEVKQFFFFHFSVCSLCIPVSLLYSLGISH